MPQGKIRIWFSNKGYGFIERNGQENLFFHITQWKGFDGSEPLQGASVSFEVGPGKKGMEAKNVRLLNANPQSITVLNSICMVIIKNIDFSTLITLYVIWWAIQKIVFWENVHRHPMIAM